MTVLITHQIYLSELEWSKQASERESRSEGGRVVSLVLRNVWENG